MPGLYGLASMTAIEIDEDETQSPYCPVCEACGDDGCCPPWICKHTDDCLYPYYENGIMVRVVRWLFRHRFEWLANWLYYGRRVKWWK